MSGDGPGASQKRFGTGSGPVRGCFGLRRDCSAAVRQQFGGALGDGRWAAHETDRVLFGRRSGSVLKTFRGRFGDAVACGGTVRPQFGNRSEAVRRKLGALRATAGGRTMNSPCPVRGYCGSGFGRGGGNHLISRSGCSRRKCSQLCDPLREAAFLPPPSPLTRSGPRAAWSGLEVV